MYLDFGIIIIKNLFLFYLFYIFIEYLVLSYNVGKKISRKLPKIKIIN
jgi:hypothetical protein